MSYCVSCGGYGEHKRQCPVDFTTKLVPTEDPNVQEVVSGAGWPTESIPPQAIPETIFTCFAFMQRGQPVLRGHLNLYLYGRSILFLHHAQLDFNDGGRIRLPMTQFEELIMMDFARWAHMGYPCRPVPKDEMTAQFIEVKNGEEGLRYDIKGITPYEIAYESSRDPDGELSKTWLLSKLELIYTVAMLAAGSS